MWFGGNLALVVGVPNEGKASPRTGGGVGKKTVPDGGMVPVEPTARTVAFGPRVSTAQLPGAGAMFLWGCLGGGGGGYVGIGQRLPGPHPRYSRTIRFRGCCGLGHQSKVIACAWEEGGGGGGGATTPQTGGGGGKKKKQKVVTVCSRWHSGGTGKKAWRTIGRAGLDICVQVFFKAWRGPVRGVGGEKKKKKKKNNPKQNNKCNPWPCLELWFVVKRAGPAKRVGIAPLRS